MKRGKKTRVSGTSKGGIELGELAEEEQNSNFGYRSITELPRYLSIDILLRLSVNRLLVCRCVCKTWRCLISDPEFAKLHLAKGEVYPLIRSLSRVHVNRILYLAEPPDPRFNWKNYSRDCICDKNWLLCEKHCPRKLDTKLKIPVRNSDLALNSEREAQANIHSATGSKRKRCIKLIAEDHRFNIVNSCRGLLCLSEPSKNDPVAVCNPITGEYINLPIPTEDKDELQPWVDSALGFSPQANQYKVIRMFSQGIRQRFQDPISGKDEYSDREAEMHILGTSSWKRIGHAPYYYGKLGYPTFLNGALHWVYPAFNSSNSIVSFNFDDDKFQAIPLPPEVHNVWSRVITLGVLRVCLCICYYEFGELFVWVMEDYGVQRSWTKKYRLSGTTMGFGGRWLVGFNEPISVLSNGGLLMFHRKATSLLASDPDGKKFKYLKFRGVESSKLEAIRYVPSFISLKDVLAREDLEVLNINSRCGGLKLLGETKTLYLQKAHKATI